MTDTQKILIDRIKKVEMYRKHAGNRQDYKEFHVWQLKLNSLNKILSILSNEKPYK